MRISHNLGLAGVVLAGLGLALGTSAAAPGKRKEPQGQSNAQLVQAWHVLRNVQFTLEKADHDYGGHRAAAVRDVKAAERQIRLALHAGHKKGKKVVGGREPQGLSNQQLAQSIPILRSTVVALGNANHDYGGHRAHAVRDLHKAIRQLEIALKYQQK